jgi:hypothetical protein
LKYWREKPTKTNTPTNKKCGTEGVQHYFTDFARSIIFTLGYYNFSIYQLIFFAKPISWVVCYSSPNTIKHFNPPYLNHGQGTKKRDEKRVGTQSCSHLPLTDNGTKNNRKRAKSDRSGDEATVDITMGESEIDGRSGMAPTIVSQIK